MYYVRTRETVLEIKNSGSGCSYFLKAYWSAWKLYRFKLFLHRGINTAHKKFHARVNAVCVHVAYTVVNCARNSQRPEHHTSVPPSRSVNSVKFSMQPFSYKINKKNSYNKKNLNTKK